MSIPIKKLIQYQISAEEYLILDTINKKDYVSLDKYTSRVEKFYNVIYQRLVNKGYLQKDYNLHTLTKEGKEILDILTPETVNLQLQEAKKIGMSIPELVKEYRDIFPRGSVNGYPAKGDKQGCIKKMRKFVKEHPEFDTDTILEATRKYVSDKKRDNYNYLMQAHYFIDKNNISMLASFCEDIVENGNVTSTRNVLDL